MSDEYNSLKNPSAMFNINVNWLTKISLQMDAFTYFRYDDDFNGMFKSIDTLELLTSPKIDNSEIKKDLDWIECNLDKWCVRDADGNIIRENTKNKSELHKRFRKCFAAILKRLDDEGILTKMKTDPMHAMSDFDV